MATYLYRLGRLSARHAWATIVVWVLILVGSAGAMTQLATPLSTQFSIPGTEFQRVLDDLKTELPDAAGGIGTVTFRSTDGSAITAEQRRQISAMVKRWEGIDGVATATDPFALQAQLDAAPTQVSEGQAKVAASEKQLAAAKKAIDANAARIQAAEAQGTPAPALADGKAQLATARAQYAEGQRKLATAKAELAAGERTIAVTDGLRFVTDDGSVARAQVVFDLPVDQVPVETKDAVRAAGATLTDAGLQVDYSKDITANLSSIMGPGEAVGLAIAAIVLLVLLGSLLAAGLPLLTALIGVAIGLLGALSMSHWVTMNDVTPALALMLGLAVGIDYSLFLVNRHREQLAHGVPLEESIGRAVGTAGSAVVVAGATVFVALAALTVTGIPFLGTMGLVAAATVVVAVLVAITLTPALLHLMGQRVLPRRQRRRLEEQFAAEEREEPLAAGLPGADAHHGPRGWGGLVTSHPNLTMLVATIVLVILSLPAASLRLGLPDGGSEPVGSTAYTTYSTVAQEFGEGTNGPLIAVGKLAEPVSAAEAGRLQLDVAEKFAAVDGVDYVVPAGISADRDTLAFQIVPTTGPSDQATVDLVERLRADAGAMGAQTGMDLGFTGQTVANIDISQRLADALPRYLVVVVGISMVLLLLVFRSVLIPIVATAGFLLSVTAAFGSVVAVYQWGWLGDLFGVTNPGPILSFLPTLAIGVLFGLAMDYQMFLVTGMRESWAHGQPARTAVRSGFRHGARVVSAAALIMASVFAGFIHAELTMIRPVGFALAIGVLIDAFIVRMTATPAVMHVLGEKAWWLPRWLGRILPDLDIEGTKLVAERERMAAVAAARTEARATARSADTADTADTKA